MDLIYDLNNIAGYRRGIRAWKDKSRHKYIILFIIG